MTEVEGLIARGGLCEYPGDFQPFFELRNGGAGRSPEAPPFYTVLNK